MPSIFELLGHVKSEVRLTAVSILDDLADHGELHPDALTAWLTQMYS